MATFNVTAVPDGEEQTTSCSCCGRPVYEGCGELQSDTVLIADYWYRWSEGHEGRFTLAVSSWYDCGERRRGIAVISGRVTDTDVIYSVLDPEDSPWTNFGEFGQVLTRDEALHGPISSNLFNVVDALVANDSRISSRILGCGLQS